MAACTAINFSRLRRLRAPGVSGVDQCMRIRLRTGGRKSRITARRRRWRSADSAACAYQGPASPVTGTGRGGHLFYVHDSCGCDGPGQGIIITALAKHTTGTAAVSYTLSFGGTTTTNAAPPGAANQLERITYLIMNNPGSTSAQNISTVGQDSNAGTNSIKLDTATVNTASASNHQLAIQRGINGCDHAGNVPRGIEAVVVAQTSVCGFPSSIPVTPRSTGENSTDCPSFHSG